MKTLEHRCYGERPEMRPDDEPEGLEKLGLLELIAASLIMSGFIVLVLYATFQHV